MTVSNATVEMSNVPKTGYSLMGYFRMYFRNGWSGKWFANSEAFNQSGVEPEESEVLRSFCQWIEDTFVGGCDDKMISFLENQSRYAKSGSAYYNQLDIGENSYAVIAYQTQFGNGDYPIRIYLYRKSGV